MSYEYLILSILMFFLSILLFIKSKNLLMNLVSIELILNSINIMLAYAGIISSKIDPFIIIFFLFAIAASEAAIGLAIIILLSKKFQTLDTDLITKVKEYYK